MVVGLGRASRAHVLHAQLHSWRLECSDWEENDLSSAENFCENFRWHDTNFRGDLREIVDFQRANIRLHYEFSRGATQTFRATEIGNSSTHIFGGDLRENVDFQKGDVYITNFRGAIFEKVSIFKGRQYVHVTNFQRKY